MGRGPISIFPSLVTELKMAPVAEIRKWEGAFGVENEGFLFVLL